MGPLSGYVPAAGLRWLAAGRPAEIAHTPGLAKELARLFPDERLDAFSRATGVDLRATPSVAAAGFDFSTLYLAETPGETRLVAALFERRLLGEVRRGKQSHPKIARLSGTLGTSPETLVTIEDRLVALSIGDPIPARLVELYALGRLRAPSALRGAALASLEDDVDDAPLRFYAPGPFSSEWAGGARGLLGVATAFGLGAWPEAGGARLRVRAVLAGRWAAEDVARAAAAWEDLSGSSLGRLLSLDAPVTPAEVRFAPEELTLEVGLALSPLVSGLRAAVMADVWEMMGDGVAPSR